MAAIAHDVLIVASWYPSIADPVAGRFVADQAAALAAAGCRVAVASFDPAGLVGSGRLRGRLANVVAQLGDRSAEMTQFSFAPQPVGAPPVIPVARLGIANGRTPDHPVLHGSYYRTVALRRMAQQMWGPGSPNGAVPRPTLIHAHTGYPDGAAAATLASLLGVPLVITEHATFLDQQLAVPAVRAAYVDAARQAFRLIGVSATFANHLRSSLPEIADRVAVVPNAVEVESFSVARPGERQPGELLWVGYLREIKGIDILIRSLALVRSRMPGVTLRLIGDAGDPALAARWRSLAAQLGVEQAVTFDTPRDRSGVAAAMRRADVFVHASRYETFGVVAAEALASGLPVVATESQGVPELLRPDIDAVGAVVPKDDPEAFAAAILRVLERRASYDEAAIRRSIVSRVGAVAVAARLIEIYDGAVGRAADTPPSPPAAAESTTLQPAPSPLVVTSFDIERAALLLRLPPAARRQIVLVTSSGSGVAALQGFRAVVTADMQDRVRAIADTRLLGPRSTGLRRLLKAARHPLATARRRGLLPGLETVVARTGGAAIERAVELARVDREHAAPILAVADGVDALAAADVIERGLASAAPGGLRWAADQATSASDQVMGRPPDGSPRGRR